MPTERWNRLDRLFREALEQPLDLRAGFLGLACGADLELREEVESLLKAAAAPGDFLSAPALDVFALQISREGWSVQPGDRIGCYTVDRRLGVGGMGEVWRGRDERLDRDVAIKVLLPGPSASVERVRALQHEARAAGALNHRNVLTVYDVGEHRGAAYLVTECLEGESLRHRLGAGRLATEEALDVTLQIARGLGAAHRRGIVHRDLKPENVFILQDGGVKILDFGLATLHERKAAVEYLASGEVPGDPSPRVVAGTAGYMAPEQVHGESVDARADVFALGAVLQEMLTGQRPFAGSGTPATPRTLLQLQTPEPSSLGSESPELSGIVRRCLAESPADRFATAAEVESALVSEIERRNRPPTTSLLAHLRRPVVLLTLLLGVLALFAGAWRWHVVTTRARWARIDAPAQIRRLLDRGETVEAFLVARGAHDVDPDDPYLRQLWLDTSAESSVTTVPEGAEVALAPYRVSAQGWAPLGRTPLERVRIPRGIVRLRLSKTGFQTIEVTTGPGRVQRFRLDSPDEVPPGMVRVVGGRDPVHFGAVSAVDDFWIDRFEVTNRQFKEFVDQGGYRRRDYWPETFSDGRQSWRWEEAVDRFRDRTGQHGPSTWKSGTFEEGQAEFPVEGVSWYEAAAYAAFAGKSLPTVYHWYRAANLGRFADILGVSNFNGKGPAAVGSYGGLGAFGTFDMAGNVKEWCWNETTGGRILLGGAWNESPYGFINYDPTSPFERKTGYGFRLAKFNEPLPKELLAPKAVEVVGRDLRNAKPVGDAIFDVYRRQYAYDPAPLNAVVEATEDTELWRKQTVELDSAHGGQRLRVHLFLPKRIAPPYQSVIFFPAGDAFVLRSSRDLSLFFGEPIIRSGRAFVFPVYTLTFERQMSSGGGPQAERELFIAWSRELGRAIDYLESRPDIDQSRLAFYGASGGAEIGVILTAIEQRLKVSVLEGGASGDFAVTPETDPVNYAPRIRNPTLLLGGRYDFETPFETAQVPFFDLIGAEHKRHVVFDTGHALPPSEVALEINAWLDRYLGPVSARPGEQ